MAFDAEPAPSDRVPPLRGRRARLARQKRARSGLVVESLETRVLLSTGTTIPAAEVSRLAPAPQVYTTAQPDGTGPEGVLFAPPSILDPPDLLAQSGNGVDDATKPNQVSWVLDFIPGKASSSKSSSETTSTWSYSPPSSSPTIPPSASPSGSSPQTGNSARTPEPIPYPPISTVPAGPKRAVMLETLEAHATRSSAQALPRNGETEIEGQWSPSDKMDVYQVSVRPNDEALRVDIRLPSFPTNSSPVHLALFDTFGTLLADQHLPSSSEGLSLLLNAISPKKDPQTVYLGVYCTPNASPGPQGDLAYTSTPVAYVLDVSLFNNQPSSSSSVPRGTTPNDWNWVMTPVSLSQVGTGSETSDSPSAGGR